MKDFQSGIKKEKIKDYKGRAGLSQEESINLPNVE
jgi:hypothetical protein